MNLQDVLRAIQAKGGIKVEFTPQGEMKLSITLDAAMMTELLSGVLGGYLKGGARAILPPPQP